MVRGSSTAAPEWLFFTRTLTRSLRSLCRRLAFLSRGLGGFNLDLGFVRQAVGAAGDDFVTLFQTLYHLNVLAIANPEFDGLLVRQAIRTSQHHGRRPVG